MKPIRHLLFALALGAACGNLVSVRQALGQGASVGELPWSTPQAATRLARLPAITPRGLPGGGVFSDWHRADLKLAPEHVDANDWGSGDPTNLPAWRLLPRSSNGWTFTGMMEIGGTVNADNPASRFNGPLAFNDRADLQLNQLYLSVGRSPRTKGSGFDWGSRIDVLFGTDYAFVQSAGWETQPDGDNALNGLTSGNGNPDLYGLAIPQAFIDLSHGQFNLRLGHFYTIVGYEGVKPSSNFFYSHTHALQYGEPLTHTGGLLSWTGSQVTLQGGIVNGWDRVDGVEDDAAFLGGFAVEGRHSSLGISVISGNDEGLGGKGLRTLYSVVWQASLTRQLAYVLQHDFGIQRKALAAGDDARWYGFSQYLYYAANDACKLGVRYEWFRDDDGVRLSGMYARNGGLGLPAAGFAGSYHNTTLGLNWTPNANLSVRPEIRWDWSAGTGFAPFADFTSDSQLTFAIDTVYTF